MEAIALEFGMCPFCGGEIEVDGENSWHCVNYELHRGTFDEPEDELVTQINALQDEIERLKKQLLAESVCRQPEECGKYDWVIEERNAEIEELNGELETAKDEMETLRAKQEDEIEKLEKAIQAALGYIERDCEKCQIGVMAPCHRCMANACGVLRKAVEK